jgi:hypothetical protein
MVESKSYFTPILIAATCLAFGVFFFIATKTDFGEFKKAERSGTVAAMEEFMTAHPDSKYIEEARARLTGLKQVADRRNQVLAPWRFMEACRVDVPDQYLHFIKEMPGSPYAAYARHRLEYKEWLAKRGIPATFNYQWQFVGEDGNQTWKIKEAIENVLTSAGIQQPLKNDSHDLLEIIVTSGSLSADYVPIGGIGPTRTLITGASIQVTFKFHVGDRVFEVESMGAVEPASSAGGGETKAEHAPHWAALDNLPLVDDLSRLFETMYGATARLNTMAHHLLTPKRELYDLSRLNVQPPDERDRIRSLLLAEGLEGETLWQTVEPVYSLLWPHSGDSKPVPR